MPGGDGTGPWWMQGRWNCRRGRMFGRGRGRFPAYADMHPTKEEMEAYAEGLKSELNEIEKRLKEIEEK